MATVIATLMVLLAACAPIEKRPPEAEALPAEKSPASAATVTEPIQTPTAEPNSHTAAPSPAPPELPKHPKANTEPVATLCADIGAKLGSVSKDHCLAAGLWDSGGRSKQGRALALIDTLSADPSRKVLLMGGIHGDEFSSVSIVFRWLEQMRLETPLGHWRVIPLLNPDGLLRARSQRQNNAGVDLNRNFPSPDWVSLAERYWRERTGSNPRRFPGPAAASEPETRWFMEQIETFNPDVIIAVHAPHSLVDYDGPAEPPTKLGLLELRQLGVYPGSLGNYAGVHLNIPVITLELPSAGIMPSAEEIKAMWRDLNLWLDHQSEPAPRTRPQ